MPQTEMNPIEFITIGTVGPKGKRQFNLQASDGSQTITMILEKEQARRMAQVIAELLDDSFKRIEDIEEELGIEVIAAVPKIEKFNLTR